MHQNRASRRSLSDLTVFIEIGMISDCQTGSGPNIIGHLKTHCVQYTWNVQYIQRSFFRKMHAFIILIYGWNGRTPALLVLEKSGENGVVLTLLRAL